MPVLFITHPEVIIEPNVPVTRWRLSKSGIDRMRVFVTSSVVENVREVWASSETKATEAAHLLAARFGLPVHIKSELGENDRTATGFLPPAEFESVADEFFARPDESIRGWETAAHAQARVLRAFEEITATQKGDGDVAIVAHGAVGTLLMCQLLGRRITRELDQPFQGHFWTFEPTSSQLLHPWRPIAPR
jgi:broad specificity phosphatase PhoE